MSDEAKMERDEHGGLFPASEGWFVANLGDAQWIESDRFGKVVRFESPELRFGELGVNVHVVQPGQPACHYHRENCQENFLVLFGECTLVIEEQERPLKAWDFVHCPPGATHVFVGAGDGPCAILMMGSRKGEATELMYPKSEVAGRHGASAAEDTSDPRVSYAGLKRPEPCPNPWAGYMEG